MLPISIGASIYLMGKTNEKLDAGELDLEDDEGPEDATEDEHDEEGVEWTD
jgi:hypothetical protein